MEIEEALVYQLHHDTGVAAIAGTRGYPIIVPQDVQLPAWAYQRIDGESYLGVQAVSDLDRARLQVSCIAESYSGAKGLAAAIQTALDGFHADMGDDDDGHIYVGMAHVSMSQDIYTPGAQVYVARLDVEIIYG